MSLGVREEIKVDFLPLESPVLLPTQPLTPIKRWGGKPVIWEDEPSRTQPQTSPFRKSPSLARWARGQEGTITEVNKGLGCGSLSPGRRETAPKGR